MWTSLNTPSEWSHCWRTSFVRYIMHIQIFMRNMIYMIGWDKYKLDHGHFGLFLAWQTLIQMFKCDKCYWLVWLKIQRKFIFGSKKNYKIELLETFWFPDLLIYFAECILLLNYDKTPSSSYSVVICNIKIIIIELKVIHGIKNTMV